MSHPDKVTYVEIRGNLVFYGLSVSFGTVRGRPNSLRIATTCLQAYETPTRPMDLRLEALGCPAAGRFPITIKSQYNTHLAIRMVFGGVCRSLKGARLGDIPNTLRICGDKSPFGDCATVSPERRKVSRSRGAPLGLTQYTEDGLRAFCATADVPCRVIISAKLPKLKVFRT